MVRRGLKHSSKLARLGAVRQGQMSQEWDLFLWKRVGRQEWNEELRKKVAGLQRDLLLIDGTIFIRKS